MVEPARASDLEPLLELLRAAHLPTEGFSDHLSSALVVRTPASIAGCVELEHYGRAALLRSLAVAPSHQGRGIGQRLTAAALESARQRRVASVYLLTMTAADFFARHFGFEPVDRGAVPAAVKESVEFLSACPDSAQAMFLELS